MIHLFFTLANKIAARGKDNCYPWGWLFEEASVEEDSEGLFVKIPVTLRGARVRKGVTNGDCQRMIHEVEQALNEYYDKKILDARKRLELDSE